MKQENIFNNDHYLKEISAVQVIDMFSKDGQNCVTVDKNIFHPHGGGQKGDQGVIIYAGKEYAVKNTVRDKTTGQSILITTEPLPPNATGELVDCKLNWEFRYQQMRLHSSVHLHHCMLEKVMGRTLRPPKTSDIQEGFAFNRYEDKTITQELVQAASEEMKKFIAQGTPISTQPDPQKEGFRWWYCGSWKIPCGGTHVADVKEIGELDISYSLKNGMPTITLRLQ